MLVFPDVVMLDFLPHDTEHEQQQVDELTDGSRGSVDIDIESNVAFISSETKCIVFLRGL